MPEHLCDHAICLTVDRRYAADWPRIERLFAGRVGTVEPHVDGAGGLLDAWLYDQTHDHPVPSSYSGRENSYWYTLSLKGAVRKAKARGWREFLLLEDDCDLLPDFDRVAGLAHDQLAASGLSPDLFYYGANHTPGYTRELSPNLVRCRNSWTTHCVKVRDTVYDDILSAPVVKAGDVIFAEDIQPNRLAVAVWPTVAIQRPGWSTLGQCFVDYAECWVSKGSTW